MDEDEIANLESCSWLNNIFEISNIYIHFICSVLNFMIPV